tara:strand:- start:126 stop:1307 length:1182 start_codon:yes stop_codon:yes gene_type:complete
MAATEKGVWNLQEVRDKQLASEWSYDGAFAGLFVAGRNTDGVLGLNDEVSRSSPTQMGSGTDWKDLKFLRNGGNTNDCSLAVKDNNTLWGWGSGGDGVLAQNSTATYSSPIQIPGTWGSCAYGHQAIVATKTNGTIWTWGNNFSGQLGANFGPPSGTYNRSSPIQVGNNSNWDTGENKVNGGDYFFTAIKTDGTLWTWGEGGWGNLGLNFHTPYNHGRSSPCQVGTDTDWSTLARGLRYDNAAIKTDGSLYVWGNNGEGQLGLNNKTRYSSPVQLSGTWRYFSGGGDTAGGVKTDGTLWAIGRNHRGQLGQNTNTYYSSPRQIPGTTWDFAQFSDTSCIGLKTDSTLWVWGHGSHGGLGLNNETQYSSPTQIPGIYTKGYLGENGTTWTTKLT